MIDRMVMHVTEGEKDALTFLRLLGSSDVMLRGQLPALALEHEGFGFRCRFGAIEFTDDSPTEALAHLLSASFNPPPAKER